MALLKTIHAEEESDPGHWFTWKEEGGEKIEFKIRHLPPAERRRINLKHLGRKRTFRIGHQGNTEQQYEPSAQAEATREMATYCLVDSRGFTFPAAPVLAGRLAGLLGEPVEGDVTLDGRWTDAIKDLMLRSDFGPELEGFVDRKADELVKQITAEAEETAGN